MERQGPASKMNIFCPWVTPKIFADITDPMPGVKAFFDHYKDYISAAEMTVLNFCTGNGDHILMYRGLDYMSDTFDWARYNRYPCDEGMTHYTHNLKWVQEAYEKSENLRGVRRQGPSFMTHDQIMDYATLKNIYTCFQEEAASRNLNFKLLEYLEPGPEFCKSVWKVDLHPEGTLERVIDVCSTLDGDLHHYSAFPNGIPSGVNTGAFVIGQTGDYVDDFGLDGVFLGNQFALCGLWNPKDAPTVTAERVDGIKSFFRGLRERVGHKLIYWMDTYWPVEHEIKHWGMSEENYAQLDAVMVSNFAVIKSDQIVPNLLSKYEVSQKFGGRPALLYSFDFVDPWYIYRTYIDLPDRYSLQRELFTKWGHYSDGITFFANDTFGFFVFEEPLRETYQIILPHAQD